jgi:hypothetical protein
VTLAFSNDDVLEFQKIKQTPRSKARDIVNPKPPLLPFATLLLAIPSLLCLGKKTYIYLCA